MATGCASIGCGFCCRVGKIKIQKIVYLCVSLAYPKGSSTTESLNKTLKLEMDRCIYKKRKDTICWKMVRWFSQAMQWIAWKPYGLLHFENPALQFPMASPLLVLSTPRSDHQGERIVPDRIKVDGERGSAGDYWFGQAPEVKPTE